MTQPVTTNVVFYHMNTTLPPYLPTFIKSIRQHMPHATITHLTDTITPGCPGVDVIERYSTLHSTSPLNLETIGLAAFSYLAQYDTVPMIFCDPDMLVVDDISDLLDTEAEVTVASRPSTDNISRSYRRLYPYNGLMVVRNSKFWKDCYWRIKRFRRMNWARNMEAVGIIINSGRYTVRFLDGDIYNAKPIQYDPRVKVYHFRIGKRKDMYMPEFYAKHIEHRQ